MPNNLKTSSDAHTYYNSTIKHLCKYKKEKSLPVDNSE